MLLVAQGASRRFGSRVALHPTTFELCEGEAVALIGPNGAGKSTLLSILAGALEPSSGEVRQRDGTRVGWAPQRPAQYGRLSPRENLEFFARLEGVPRPERATERLLSDFELPQEDRPSDQLSVGNRQRLNVAIALLGEPRVLLLDEPAASLDPRQRRLLWQRAERLRDDGGGVVFATQTLDEVERFSDRVACLLDGAVVFDGSLESYRESRPLAEVFA